jgi:hypothetical protein
MANADKDRPPDDGNKPSLPAEPAAASEEPETERGGSPATHSSSRINEEEEQTDAGQK